MHKKADEVIDHHICRHAQEPFGYDTKMTKSEYKIVQVHDSSNADQTDDGKDYDDEYTENINGDIVTVASANDSDDPHFLYKATEKHTMQTPSTIISLIFIYFVLSIGLTFYQRSLLKVNTILDVRSESDDAITFADNFC